MLRVFCALVALCLLCWAAVAKQEKVGGVAVNLPPPAGYCELNEAQPGDARMLSVLGGVLEKGGNRLVAMSADCRQLDDWRNGKRPLLANYAQYQTQKASENASLPAAPAEVIKATCQQLRAQGEIIATRMVPDIQKRFDEALTAVRYNESKFLGVLGEDSKACYASLLSRIRAENGADVAQVGMFAVTIIKGKPIFYYLFAPYVGAPGITSQLDQLRRNVAALEAANRN
jgi:hypothetical protein